MNVSKTAVLVLVTVMTAVTAAQAQDFDRVIPRPPPPKSAPQVAAPPADQAGASADQTVLLPLLKGVVFVYGQENLASQPIAAAGIPGGVGVDGVAPLDDDEFKTQVRSKLGRPLTRADLEALANLVRERFRRAERPFVEVTVPPQDVETGMIQVLVTEYRVGQVRVEGARWFSDALILRMGELNSGDTLTLPELRKALDDYNQNSFLTVSAVARPGASTGLSDIVLQARDRFPARVYAGFDNQGSPSLGREEAYVGFNLGNFFDNGQTLSYQFTRSTNGAYVSHSFSDVALLGPDERLIVYGAYAIQKPPISPFFKSVGHAGQISVRYAQDLAWRPRARRIVQVGVDFKRTDNNLDFSGFRLLRTAVEIVQFPIIYSAVLNDAGGQTTIENQLVLSPGGLTGRNTDEALAELVPLSDATYAFNRASVTRTSRLPGGATAITRLMGQLATTNLPYSEQLGGGGLGSVRGYDTNAILGSQGIVFSQEFRTRPFSLLRAKSGPGADRFQLGAFFDYAYLAQKNAVPNVPTHADIASLGVSAHYTLGRYVDIEFDIGRQLRVAPGRAEHDTQAVVVVTASF